MINDMAFTKFFVYRQSEIKSLPCARHSGNSVSIFELSHVLGFVGWLSYLMVILHRVTFFTCLRAASGWLSLAITIITAYLKTGDSCGSLLCNRVSI